MLDTERLPEGYLEEVRAFADSIGKRENFEKWLDYLATFGTQPGVLYECRLLPDFAPHSFFFIMERNGGEWFHGGLIFFAADKEWSVHT